MEASVLIVEDEYVVALDLQERLCRLGFCKVAISHNYEDALTQIVQHPPDIALLDINLGKGKSGIDLALLICDNWDFPIIFITAYSSDDVITDALEALPSAYITKPFKDTDIKSSIMIALNHKAAKVKHKPTIVDAHDFHVQANKLYFTKEKSSLIPIKTDEVLWLEAMDNYTRLHTPNKKVMVHAPLKDVLKKLEPNFIRIHRSFAIAIDKISKVDGNYVYLEKHPIGIGASYKKEVLSRLQIL